MPITHEWNGTILTITSDSGTSSADLKGAKGDDGARGAQGIAGSAIAEDAVMLGGIVADEYATKVYVDTAIANADIDLTPYATKDYVDNAVDNVDLSNYYNKEEIDTTVSDINRNIEYYATKDYVDKKAQAYNLLDNSDFRNPINQRGQTTYTGKSYAYTLDRWLISNGTTVINLLDNGIELDNTNNSNNVDFYQVLPITLNDGIYTFVINTTNGMVYCCASVNGTTITNISRVSMDTISASIMYTNSMKFYVKGTVKGGSVSTILWVALYEGTYTAETLPPYVPKGYAVELAECQRYYYGISTTDAYLSWHGYFQSATEARFTIPIGTQMRANPTLTFGDIGSLRIYGGGVTSIPSTINGARVIGNAVVVSLGGFTNGDSGEVVAKINTTFALSADL